MKANVDRVGEVRPTQLVYTFGVGASVDLPHLSAIILGLEGWDVANAEEIDEPRLLAAVRGRLGRHVASLRLPPYVEPTGTPFDDWAKIGVPVGVFPRWLRCPRCNFLGSVNTGLFQLKTNPFHPDEAHYEHQCTLKGRPPIAIATRFLLACEAGHLDDFPWVEYVHRGNPCSSPVLELYERGVTGRAAEVMVKCRTCDQPARSMADAFGETAERSLPRCRGRHPHLRMFEACARPTRTILLGASNAWFPVTLSVLSVPFSREPVEQKVAEFWRLLRDVTSLDVLRYARATHQQLAVFAKVPDQELWDAIQRHRKVLEHDTNEVPDILAPEWMMFASPDDAPTSDDFRLQSVPPPPEARGLVEQVVLAERLREVVALIGFTRIAPPDEVDAANAMPRAPLARGAIDWVPCAEVRGEGVFIRLPEDRVSAWEEQVRSAPRVKRLLDAHRRWRLRWGLHPEEGWRGPRYLLLHTLSHVLIREFALECGYGAASLKERLYVGTAERPMAGILLYTAAPDSEGTLGGLVSLGHPENLGRLIRAALERTQFCSSDPLCAEHSPTDDRSLHGAACHACLYVPETSCERGNRYLDRGLLVPVFGQDGVSYFRQ